MHQCRPIKKGKREMSVKRKVERQIVSANGSKKSKVTVGKPATTPTKEKTAAKKGKTRGEVVTPEQKKKALGMRIGAGVLWLLAIACEVLAILLINGTLYIPGNEMTYLIIAIVVDLIFVFAGAMLWKQANRIDPASKKNKVKFFLWNQMGLIAALVAFVPLVIYLLKDKELDEKTKKIVSIVAIVAALIAVGTSIDYTPASAEDLAAADENSYIYSDGTAYWTRFGKCYHFDQDCQSLLNSEIVYEGTVAEAFEADRSKPCSFCADAEVLEANKTVSGSDILAGLDDLLASDSDSDRTIGDDLLAPAA